MGEQETNPQSTQTAAVAAEVAIRRSANWFYWIAGLSVANMVMQASGSNYSMVLGTGISQVSQAMAQSSWSGGATVPAVALFGLTALFVLAFVLLGWKAGQPRTWAFIAGMVLYGLDSAVFIFAGDWLGIGFHAFVLYMLYRGLALSLQLKRA